MRNLYCRFCEAEWRIVDACETGAADNRLREFAAAVIGLLLPNFAVAVILLVLFACALLGAAYWDARTPKW